MKSVIVGTAGHIDHGKTALVRTLTGIDPDRLEEEKRRGITIDIGFANLELSSPSGEPLRVGFVDVPGHERFVRNMLAGIGGIDLVLLIVSAEESIKPQTREHFDICRLLNIQRGIVVLTKSDLVDPETLEVVRSEVAEFVKGSFLDGAPVLPVSALTGEGIADLRRELARAGGEIESKDSSLALRLPIDRVFTMKGFGTVVTGTLVSGTIRKEEEVEVFPLGRRLRVRGLQVHGAPAEQTVAGQRTAVNLAGIEVEELARGMTLAAPGLFRPTRRLDAEIRLLERAKPIKQQARVHLHAFSSETIADVLFLDSTCKQLSPGDSCYAQLRLSDPLLLFPGDRFVLRQFSPVVTIGGGTVVDALPMPKQTARERLDGLPSLVSADAAGALEARIRRRGTRGLSTADAVAETGWLPARVEQTTAALVRHARSVRFGKTLLGTKEATRARASLLEELRTFHDMNRLVAGISREELRDRLHLEPEVFAGVLDSLLREQKVGLGGEQVSLAGRGVAMKSDEADSRRLIETTFAAAGLKVPSLKEVLAGLKLDPARAQQIVTLLLREKVLVKIGEDLVFHQSTLDALRKLVASQKPHSPKIDVARFKDLTGVSRKYAIPLLEYLDRERVTCRVGDERVIL